MFPREPEISFFSLPSWNCVELCAKIEVEISQGLNLFDKLKFFRFLLHDKFLWGCEMLHLFNEINLMIFLYKSNLIFSAFGYYIVSRNELTVFSCKTN